MMKYIELIDKNSKEKLKELLKDVELKELEFERLNEELSNISFINASSILLLKYISDYAKENNEYVFYRGYVYNSYICYLLGITDINPLDEKHYLYSELLYGVNHEKQISLDINVSKQFKTKLLECLDELLDGKIFKAMFENNKSVLKFHSTKYIIPLEESKYEILCDENKEKYIEIDWCSITIPFINLNICVIGSLYQINNLIKKYGYPDKNILDDKKITNMLLVENKTAGVIVKKTRNKYYFDSIEKVDFNTYVNYCSAITGAHEIIDFEEEAKKDFFIVNKYPTTRDRVVKILLDSGIDRTSSFNIVDMLTKGIDYREDNFEVWIKYRNILNDYIKDKNLFNYLLNIQYIFPLGHVIAYSKLDYLLTYYKLNYSDFYDIMLGDNLTKIGKIKRILASGSKIDFDDRYYLGLYLEKMENGK